MLSPSELQKAKSAVDAAIILLEWYGNDQQKQLETYTVYEGQLFYVKALLNNARRFDNRPNPEMPKYLEFWIHLKGKTLFQDNHVSGTSEEIVQAKPNNNLYYPNAVLVLHMSHPETFDVFRKGDWLVGLERITSVAQDVQKRIQKKAFEDVDDF
jgi:hypothetical protein